MKSFSVLDSKSIVNRALIINSFSGHDYKFNSNSQDVLILQKALNKLGHKVFDLGEGGTSFRFFLARVSRLKGSFTIKISERLFQRPHNRLFDALESLGVNLKFSENTIHLDSCGWTKNEIEVDCEKSTQFISAILLSSFNLSFDLTIYLKNLNSSLSYFYMTLEVLTLSGLNYSFDGKKIVIKKNQPAGVFKFRSPDLSSCFSLASAGVLSNGVLIKNLLNQKYFQGDKVFLDIFKQLGINYKQDHLGTLFNKKETLNSIEANLKDSPDLLPVLGVLCSFSDGISTLKGIKNCRYKESNRVKKTLELLKACGVEVLENEDYLEITGGVNLESKYSFDPDQDHRMAMAAGILGLKIKGLKVLNKEVVNKSYPSFWDELEQL